MQAFLILGSIGYLFAGACTQLKVDRQSEFRDVEKEDEEKQALIEDIKDKAKERTENTIAPMFAYILDLSPNLSYLFGG